jgi:hypothetical protein
MMLPMFKKISQVMFFKAVEDLRRFCFHIFYRHKMGFVEHRLDLWEEKEVSRSEIWGLGWVPKPSDVLVSYKLLHRQCVVDRHVILVQNLPVSP